MRIQTPSKVTPVGPREMAFLLGEPIGDFKPARMRLAGTLRDELEYREVPPGHVACNLPEHLHAPPELPFCPDVQHSGVHGTERWEADTKGVPPMERCRVHIRWMIRRDLAEVLEIERSAFEFPWLEEEFIRCLRQRNCIGMVAEYGERVVGYMIYELHKTKLHLLNFAVDKEFRRRGVGRQMVEKLTGNLRKERRHRLSLEVRETNTDAQVFFRECGFHATHVLKNFYDDSWEDAYLFQYHVQREVEAEDG